VAFLWARYLSSRWGILFTNSQGGKTELGPRESNKTTANVVRQRTYQTCNENSPD
jgi:hypothetical protein